MRSFFFFLADKRGRRKLMTRWEDRRGVLFVVAFEFFFFSLRNSTYSRQPYPLRPFWTLRTLLFYSLRNEGHWLTSAIFFFSIFIDSGLHIYTHKVTYLVRYYCLTLILLYFTTIFIPIFTFLIILNSILICLSILTRKVVKS